MDDSKNSTENKEVHHTANYLIARFFCSKESLSEKYALEKSHISLARYICDSIDMNYAKTGKFSTKLSNPQKALYGRVSLRMVKYIMKHLIEIKLFKKPSVTSKNLTVGELLTERAVTAPLDEIKSVANDLNLSERATIAPQKGQPLPPSYNSLLLKSSYYVDQKKENEKKHSFASKMNGAKQNPIPQPPDGKYQPAKSASKASSFVEEFMKQKQEKAQ